MRRNNIAGAVLAGAMIMSTATPTEAAEVAVSGSMTGTSSSVGAASCSPLLFLSTLNGTGSSPLGSFNYTHHVCISGPGPIQGVDFLLDFSNGDTLYGDLNGTATPSGVPLVSNLSLTYEILGGTGQFLNATGDFAGTGTVDQRFGAPQVSLNFSAVPEPATWAMMLVGMGAIGAAMRRRPARSNVPQLA